MKKLLLTFLVICISLVILSSTDTIDNKEVVARGCKCRIMVECYYPGYRPGIDLPFASKIVYSCAEADEYMQYILSQTIEYPDGWMEVPEYCERAFFFLYPAPAKNIR